MTWLNLLSELLRDYWICGLTHSRVVLGIFLPGYCCFSYRVCLNDNGVVWVFLFDASAFLPFILVLWKGSSLFTSIFR